MAPDTDFFTDAENLKPLSTVDFKKLLQQEASKSGHKRQQKLLNALTDIAMIAIYIVPSVLAFLFLCVLIHKGYVMGEWDALETTLTAMLIPVTTYLAGLLSKNVLPMSRGHE